MGVVIECPFCKDMNPMANLVQRVDFARNAVFLDPSPSNVKESILNVKCMRHGVILFTARIPIMCPIDPTMAGIIKPL